MKIIKHGKRILSKTNAINTRFRCWICGCEWIANVATECEQLQPEYYGYNVCACNCPDCNTENISIITAIMNNYR